MIIERTGQRNSGGKCSGKIRFSSQDFVVNKAQYLVACDPKGKGYGDGERVALVEATNHLPFFGDDCPLVYAEEYTDALYRWSLQQRGEKRQPRDICVDRVISFHPDDPLTPAQGLELAKEAVAQVMGPIEERLCLFAVHVNEQHLHVHVLVSTVNTHGIIFNPRNDDKLWNRVADKLEAQRGLRQVSQRCRGQSQESTRRQTTKAERQRERRTGKPGIKTAIGDILDRAISKADRDFYRFLDLIADEGVWPVANLRKQDGPIRGIGFECRGEYFSGSDLGKNYRWGALKKAIGYSDSSNDRALLWGLKEHYDSQDLACELNVDSSPVVNMPTKTPTGSRLLGHSLSSVFDVSPMPGGLSFRWRSSKREAFREQNKPLKLTTTYGRNRKVVKAMVERVCGQGAKCVRVKGSDRFKALVNEFTAERGITVIEDGLSVQPALPAVPPPEQPKLTPKRERASIAQRLGRLRPEEQRIVTQLAKLRYKRAPEPLAAALAAYLVNRRQKAQSPEVKVPSP